MTKEDLQILLDGCRTGNRLCQKQLYQLFYNYGMTVCYRYARHRQEAQEMLNDAFMKVFSHLVQFSSELSFKAWLNKILINNAIDHYRRHYRELATDEIETVGQFSVEPEAVSNLSLSEKLELVRRLPPTYRLVFNLYAIEGYRHSEIAAMLGIEESTSQSNLTKARAKLRAMIEQSQKINLTP